MGLLQGTLLGIHGPYFKNSVKGGSARDHLGDYFRAFRGY